MKLLFLGAMVAGVVFLIAFGNSNPSLRRAFPIILLGTALIFFGITAVCLLFPFFSHAEGRFLPMLLAFFPGCIGLVAVADSFLVVAGERLHTASRPCWAISGVGDLPPDPSAAAQLSAYPNPFNPRIEIAFELDRAQPVSLEVYDLAGRKVTDLAAGEYASASHRVFWDGNDSQGRAAADGGYFVLLRGDRDMQSLKITLVR